MREKVRRSRIQAGLFLAFVIFLSLSLYSYDPGDPSAFNFSGLSLKINNFCGIIGASLAEGLYQMFGASSWLILFGVLMLCYRLLSRPFNQNKIPFLASFLVFMLSVSSLAELHFSELSFFNGEVSLGGVFGKSFISVLIPLFSFVGTAVILWSAFCLFLLFYSQWLFSPALFYLPKKTALFFMQSLKQAFKWSALFSKSNLSFLKNNLRKSRAVFPYLKGLWLKVYKKFKPLDSPVLSKDPPLKAQNFKSPPDNFKPVSELLKSSQDSNTALFIQKAVPSKDSFNSSQEPSHFFLQNKVSLPSFNLLLEPPSSSKKILAQDVEAMSKTLIDKLNQFSIEGEIKAIKTGPALVLFEFKPEEHIKVSQIKKMESDLSLALSSESVRIIAPIPGRDVVGIEASMPYRETVYLKNLLKSESFSKAQIPLVLGRRADNKAGIKDLARIPHLLVAGTTGSGKSMFIISFICSLLFRHKPDTLRLLLIDPKQVDLSFFKDLPHLLAPIITNSQKAVRSLCWAIQEMEKRYRSLSEFKARDHQSFNQIVKKLSDKDRHELKNQELEPQQRYYFEPLPLICIVIEEFGDLMADMSIRRTIENAVVRLAQKARASGIHLVLAMQSPRKDVLTGLIKTNIPGRISFKVASGTDSRVILDDMGAERLLSHGDMLFLEPGSLKATRYHGPLVRDKELSALVQYWRDQAEPSYEEALVNEKAKSSFNESAEFSKQDPMYEDILDFIKSCDVVSTSLLQRKFQIGYPRAGRIIQTLFEQGQIGPPKGSKPREVLINK